MKKLIESMDHIEECGMTEMPAAMPAPEMDKGNPVTVNVSMNASGKEHVADLLDMMKNAGLGGAEPVGAKMLSPRMDMERLSSIMGEPKDEPEMEEIEEGADPKLASMIAKFVDDVEAELRYFGQPDAAKVGMLIKQGNVEDAAGEMADAMTDQDGGSDKFDMVMQTAQEYIEDYMSEDESYAAEMDDEEDELAADIEDPMDDEEAETEDMSSEGTYTVKVKGKDMDSQMELARLAGLPTNEVDDEVEEAGGDYENEPDEEYSDLSAVIPDGDDLHKQKKSHPATAGGDNPMSVESIKATLMAALQEKKLSEGELPAALKAYQAKKGKGKAPAKGKSKSGKMPMGAGPDGKKGTKDDKPAFLTKEGVATKDCPECGAAGKKKLMACSTCGCK